MYFIITAALCVLINGWMDGLSRKGKGAGKQKKGKDRKVMGWEREVKGKEGQKRGGLNSINICIRPVDASWSWLEGPDPRIPQLDTPL